VKLLTQETPRENIAEEPRLRLSYLDTSIWNRLCDEEADPGLVLSVFETRGSLPVLGSNVFYEVAKCFSAGRSDKTLRGQDLCKYLKSYMARRIPIAMENWALLIEEAFHVVGNPIMDAGQRTKRYEENFSIAYREIEKLSEGNFEEKAASFIANRKLHAHNSRSAIRAGLDAKPQMKALLLSTDEAALPKFMDDLCVGVEGLGALHGHLRELFPQDPDTELAVTASRLLGSARYRVARAITRADIYLCWRCVHRGSLRSDLPDDTFHVTAAAYCQEFLTTEPDQADIATRTIDGIRARIYTGDEPVLQWLAAA
jgi:hypothetical protein